MGNGTERLNEEVSKMDLEKLESKVMVDVKTKRAAVQAKSSGFRLTERDLELLGFLLDQKFASLEQVYFRFFDVRGKVTDELRGPLANSPVTSRTSPAPRDHSPARRDAATPGELGHVAERTPA